MISYKILPVDENMVADIFFHSHHFLVEKKMKIVLIYNSFYVIITVITWYIKELFSDILENYFLRTLQHYFKNHSQFLNQHNRFPWMVSNISQLQPLLLQTNDLAPNEWSHSRSEIWIIQYSSNKIIISNILCFQNNKANFTKLSKFFCQYVTIFYS